MIDLLSLQDWALLVIGVLTITAAIMALEAEEVIYGAVSLAGMFLGIAGLFILLDATYAAMFQISVYLGAIAVLALFTIMVVPYELWKNPKDQPSRQWLLPALTNFLLLSALFLVITESSRINTEPPSWSWSLDELGLLLFDQHGVSLLILGVVLAVALMGALAITSKEDDE